MPDPRPRAAIRLQRTETGFVINAEDLGAELGLAASEVPRLMREGKITSLSEEGQGEDAGRHRITFRHAGTTLRLILDDAGNVLQKTRVRRADPPKGRARAAKPVPGRKGRDDRG